MPIIPGRLLEASEILKDGGAVPRESLRSLLRWFGAQRPGHYVTKRIDEALTSLGLATDPPIGVATLDQLLAITLVPHRQSHSPPNDTPEAHAQSHIDASPIAHKRADPAYRIGNLPAANHPPVSVPPTSTVTEAITIMLARDFSQLPIIDNHRHVKGIISWRSIGKALHFERSPASVSECMEIAHDIDHEVSLFEAIPRIIEHEYVLVHDANGRITGIVTNADLSLQFYTLSEPFLLLSEIENQLRVILDIRLPLATLVNGKDPRDTTRVVTCASDLSFGEYKRIMDDPANWDALNLRIDRRHFIEQLEQVRTIRNDVMHFDPAGIKDAELAALQKFNRFVHELSPALANGNHLRN